MSRRRRGRRRASSEGAGGSRAEAKTLIRKGTTTAASAPRPQTWIVRGVGEALGPSRGLHQARKARRVVANSHPFTTPRTAPPTCRPASTAPSPVPETASAEEAPARLRRRRRALSPAPGRGATRPSATAAATLSSPKRRASRAVRAPPTRAPRRGAGTTRRHPPRARAARRRTTRGTGARARRGASTPTPAGRGRSRSSSNAARARRRRRRTRRRARRWLLRRTSPRAGPAPKNGLRLSHARYLCTRRGDAAAASWIFRRESLRRRRGCRVDPSVGSKRRRSIRRAFVFALSRRSNEGVVFALSRRSNEGDGRNPTPQENGFRLAETDSGRRRGTAARSPRVDESATLAPSARSARRTSAE